MKSLEPWKNILTDSSLQKKYIDSAKEIEEKIHSFLEFRIPESLKNNKDGIFKNVPFAVKDNIAVKDFKCSCASKFLQDFVSPYTATAVQKLEDAGAIVCGKNNLDEFGMGSSCDNSALALSHNPWDNSRVCGGSSGGSAASVAAGLVPFSLGSDTGGSVRQPAAFCGVYGLKPTYGTVSRFGLVAFASSLEGIGVLSRDLEILRAVYDSIKGQDPLDQTSVSIPEDNQIKEVKKIACLSGDLGLDPAVEKAYNEGKEALAKLGYELIDCELPILDYVIPAYYTIATAEASANLARYNGIRYGSRASSSTYEEMVRKSRDEGFGEEVKLRILLGTYVLRSGFQDQYYIRAQKIRTAIAREMDKLFQKADLLFMPVFPTLAFHHGDSGLSSFQQKLADRFTATANLCGMPALSVPCGLQQGLPAGMQFMAPLFQEERCFQAAENLAKKIPVEICPDSFRI